MAESAVRLTIMMGIATLTTGLALKIRSNRPKDEDLQKLCREDKQKYEMAMEEGYRSTINTMRRAYYDCYYINKHAPNAK